MVVRMSAALLALALTGLAGCASQGGAPAPEKAVSDLAVRATATTGVIRGLVVDAAIRPLAGATVLANPGNRTTATNAQGAFGFDGLAPGTYFLTASKAGYATLQQSTSVQAGVDAPAPVRIQLTQLPSSKPYHDVVKFNGNQAMAATLFYPANPVLGDHSGIVSGVPMAFNGSFRSDYTYSPVPTWEQNVLAWTAKTAAATHLEADQCVYLAARGQCDDQARYSNATSGPSPLIFSADAKLQKAFAAGGNLVDDIIVWASGATGSAVDLGMTVDQDFTLVTVHTYNYVPPDGYRFDHDGEPVDPA